MQRLSLWPRKRKRRTESGKIRKRKRRTESGKKLPKSETSQRSHLMVYLETQGRRIIGSHFSTESGPLLPFSVCSVKEEVAKSNRSSA